MDLCTEFIELGVRVAVRLETERARARKTLRVPAANTRAHTHRTATTTQARTARPQLLRQARTHARKGFRANARRRRVRGVNGRRRPFEDGGGDADGRRRPANGGENYCFKRNKKSALNLCRFWKAPATPRHPVTTMEIDENNNYTFLRRRRWTRYPRTIDHRAQWVLTCFVIFNVCVSYIYIYMYSYYIHAAARSARERKIARESM